MKNSKYWLLRLVAKIKSLLDLNSDFDREGTYIQISQGVEFRSGNAWGLIFAMLIASIGLNVNSTAIIIGAMLISPLMGPIVGAGFSLGTHDLPLLKNSIKNFAYAVAISIISSAIFFLISPTGTIQSELIARTQPTIFDALVAFFGGAAGIVASTRVNKGNAVPGVAIATALMPPLCTVGYSIAHFELQYALGALYLFTINAVFILISTYLFTRILGFKLATDRDMNRDRILHRYMTWGSFVFILPSIAMAWYLQKKSTFQMSLDRFITTEINFPTTIIAKKEVFFDLRQPKVSIFLFGDELNTDQISKLTKKIANYPPLENTVLKISSSSKDSFSINDLEEKFVRRSELSQLIKIEESKKINSAGEENAELKAFLLNEFGQQVYDIEIYENKINIFWKVKPNKLGTNLLEKSIYKHLAKKEFSFTHSLILK